MLRAHPVLLPVTVVYLVLVAWVTLGPQPLDDNSESWLRSLIEQLSEVPYLTWISYGRVEFMANVAMIIPLGVMILALLGRRRWWLVILLGVVLSCGIEFVQLYLPMRVSDPRDLVSNTMGIVIGVIFGAVLLRPRR